MLKNPISENQFDNIFIPPISLSIGEPAPPQDNLLIWLDAAFASSLDAVSDGDPVGSWQDRNGGKTFTQSTGSLKPILKLGIQNSLPVIRGDGVDDFLDLGDDSDLELDDFSIFFVTQRLSLVRHTIFCMQCQGGGSGGGAGVFIEYENAALLVEIFDGAFKRTKATITGLYDINTFFLVSIIKIGGGSSAITIRVDGAEPSLAANDGMPVSIDYTTSTSLRTLLFALHLHNSPGSPSEILPYQGDFGEFLLYDSGISDSNRDLTEEYLSCKWGIPLV